MLKPTRVRHYLALMKARGFAPEVVLAGSGIELPRCSDPDYLIQTEQCHTVVSQMMRLTGNAALGLEIGAETRIADLGIIGYAMASSKTLRQMIEIWSQYGLSPVGFAYSFPAQIADRADGGWSMSSPSTAVGDSIARFYIEEALAMGLKNFGPMLTGAVFDVESVMLPYRAQADVAVYERFFGCPVQFRSAQTGVVVRSPSLDAAASDADDDLRELCLRHCGQLLQQANRYGPVSVRLWRLLGGYGGVPSLHQAALRLSMSPRSLRRYLLDEGTSYQTVLDQFRCSLAKAYLGTGTMPAKEIGFLLGFSRADAFNRAFKQWTGETVGAYRRAATGTMFSTLPNAGERESTAG